MTQAQSVLCGTCGAPRERPPAGSTERSPCPACGGTSLHYSVHIHESIRAVADSVDIDLMPGQQDRDWKQRWTAVQADMKRLKEPRSEQLSGTAIHAARHELHSLFVQAYHLKDALILDGVQPKITVESAVTHSASLSLLADLANLDKHGKLTKPPRSGSVPSISRVSGYSVSPSKWQVSMTISHNGKALDGLRFAEDAIAAWETQLQAWGAI